MSELAKRGFDAQLAGDTTIYLPKEIHVLTVHASPWYVRSANFLRAAADQIAVYVLLGREKTESARFFIARNSDLAYQFRQPQDWQKFGVIDIESVGKYEDNWDILDA
jgi:hypothetical protein